MQELNLIGVLSTDGGGRLPVIEPKTITANGTYNVPSGVDGFNPVVVNVPSQEPNIQPKSIFENGTYNVPSGVDGFNPVVVDVPSKEEITLYANQNGTYTSDEGKVYNNVVVNVPLPQNTYLLKSVANLPQATASFNDGQEMVMPSLKVAIEPQQEGSGDPSPTNIRPFSGWDKVDVTRTGKNLVESILINTTINTNGEINVSGGSSTFDMHIAKIIKGETYTIQSDESENVNQKFVGGFFYDMPQLGSISYNNSRLANTPATFSAPIDGYVAFRTSHNYAFAQIEFGTTATTYEPYNGHTYTIDLDGTRYGGEVDVINGIVTPAPYYASYNGETLTGEWISDRDKYEVGATPTIGAQVVNIGASGTPVSILPTAVKSLRGVNNVWADTGDIKDVEYFSKEDKNGK